VRANGDLVIANLNFEDMGEYTCRVENDAGFDEVTTFVYPFAMFRVIGVRSEIDRMVSDEIDTRLALNHSAGCGPWSNVECAASEFRITGAGPWDSRVLWGNEVDDGTMQSATGFINEESCQV
ncbi:unnamed protein product, partial [Notodromas monacha]